MCDSYVTVKKTINYFFFSEKTWLSQTFLFQNVDYCYLQNAPFLFPFDSSFVKGYHLNFSVKMSKQIDSLYTQKKRIHSEWIWVYSKNPCLND